MKKLSALLLTLAFMLSLAACKKDNTSSDSSSLSALPSQAEQSETDTSAEQTSEVTAKSETESKTETVSPSITSDKKGSTSKSTPKQNVSSQPKSSTPSQKPIDNKPTQPTQPTQPKKLNPKTDFKIGRYRTIVLDNNNNQICYRIDMDFQKDEQYNGYVTYYADRFFTKELCQQNGLTPNENTSKVVLNGITYYEFEEMYDMINGIFEMTDTLVKVDNQGGKLDNLSLNADGTLVLETNGGVIKAKIGTIFTFVQ